MMKERRRLSFLWRSEDAAAAAEMALVMPLLVVLTYAPYEIGKYFLDEHIVTKAVRDGARFASRQRMANMPCGGTATNETAIKNVVRTGSPTGTQARISYWTDPATITVTITCVTTGDYVDAGLYQGLTDGIPVVNVRASVPYRSLFNGLGFDTAGFALVADSEAAVAGI